MLNIKFQNNKKKSAKPATKILIHDDIILLSKNFIIFFSSSSSFLFLIFCFIGFHLDLKRYYTNNKTNDFNYYYIYDIFNLRCEYNILIFIHSFILYCFVFVFLFQI